MNSVALSLGRLVSTVPTNDRNIEQMHMSGTLKRSIELLKTLRRAETSAVAFLALVTLSFGEAAQASGRPAKFCADNRIGNTVANYCAFGPSDSNFSALGPRLIQEQVDKMNRDDPGHNYRADGATTYIDMPYSAAIEIHVDGHYTSFGTGGNQNYEIAYSFTARMFSYCAPEGRQGAPAWNSATGSPMGNFVYTCQATIFERNHDNPIGSCPYGNPIYPLTGSKGLTEALGNWTVGAVS